MATAFGRKYSLKIGKNKELVETNIPATLVPYFDKRNTIIEEGLDLVLNGYYSKVFKSQIQDAYTDVAVLPPQALTIEELRIEASVQDNKNTSSKSEQKAVIKIYNLAKDKRDFIRVGHSVILKAGYEQDGDELPLLYVGQILSVDSERRGEDIVTTLKVKPATLFEEIKINRSYPPNTTAMEVMQDLANVAASRGLPTGEVFPTEVMDILVYPFGLSLSGDLLEALQNFCNTVHYRAYVLLGKLYIEPVWVDRNAATITVRDEDIKTSAQSMEEASNTTLVTDGSAKGAGLRVNLFLNGNINTSTFVRMDSENYQGDYRVLGVKHKLDLEGSAWDTEVHLSEIKDA